MSMKDVEKVSIQSSQIKYLAGKYNLTYDQVVELMKQFLQFILEQTILEVESYIMKIVPVRTGELRDQLLLKLRNSFIQGFVVKIFIWSELPYTARVNRMSTYNVRHTGTWYENPDKRGYQARARDKYGKYVYLFDPTAEGNFFDKLVAFTKERISLNIARAKMMIAKGSPLTVRGMSAISG